MSKTERQATVESLTELLKGSPNVFVTDFSGLNVLRMTELRRRLRGAGVEYVVVKNTLAQRAFAANGVHALDEHLAGPTGLVLSGSPDEGALIGGAKPVPSVPGRGQLVTRDEGRRVVQLAWSPATV